MLWRGGVQQPLTPPRSVFPVFSLELEIISALPRTAHLDFAGHQALAVGCTAWGFGRSCGSLEQISAQRYSCVEFELPVPEPRFGYQNLGESVYVC